MNRRWRGPDADSFATAVLLVVALLAVAALGIALIVGAVNGR